MTVLYVVKALNGMRESDKAFLEVVRDMYITHEWTLLQTVPCFAYNCMLDSLARWHGDDFYTVWSTRSFCHRSKQRCSLAYVQARALNEQS